MENKYPLFVLVAPSGSGKTTLLQQALQLRPVLYRPVTATTRKPRAEEQDGVDYHFITEEKFRAIEAAGGFVETSAHYSALYGCPLAELEQLATRPGIIIVEVDGAASLERLLHRTINIFIKPGSKEELVKRLSARENSEGMVERIARIDHEWEIGSRYTEQVVNEDISKATHDLLAIIDRHLA